MENDEKFVYNFKHSKNFLIKKKNNTISENEKLKILHSKGNFLTDFNY